MAKLRKSHSNYILRKKRQLTTKGAIYERDWMTVSEMDGFAPGTLPVYASGNFKMTVNDERGGKKKYSFSDWYLTDSGGENWTLSSIREESLKVRNDLIKPNYTSILDFAYYGSAVELVRGTVNDITARYPGELFTTNKALQYATNSGTFEELVNVVENPFGIDVFTPYVIADRVDNPYRYMALSWDKYEVIEEDGSGNTIAVYTILGWDPGVRNPDACLNGDKVFEGAKIYIDRDCVGPGGETSQWKTGGICGGTECNPSTIDRVTIPLGNDSIYYYPAMLTVYRNIHEYNGEPPKNLKGELLDGDTALIPMGNKTNGDYKYYPELQLVSRDVHEYNPMSADSPEYDGNITGGTGEDETLRTATIPLGNSSENYDRKLLDVNIDTHEYGYDRGDSTFPGTELIPRTELTPYEAVELVPKRAEDCDAITFDGVLVNGNVYLVSDSGTPWMHIRLKEEYIDEIFGTFDDFEQTLLDRETKPMYKAKFYTPKETDNGVVTHLVSYIWPRLSGGWNLDLISNAYESYLEGLLYIASYYDECRSDNIWRSYTHESIKNFDWTTPRDTYIPEIDGHLIDVERIEGILKVCGRQFDDLKRYIENIKYTVNVSYDSKNNMPDQNMSKFLEDSGWEVKNVAPVNDNSLVCVEEYPGKDLKVRPEDCNMEFLKRMILNSRNILSKKGTRAGIEAMYSMFGIFDLRHGDTMVYCGNTEEVGYTIEEYDVFTNDYIVDDQDEKLISDYDKIVELNREKSGYVSQFEKTDDDFCGLMVARVADDYGVEYIVPWYDADYTYDGYPYYQMFGGWGRRDRKDVLVNFGPDFVVNRQLVSDTGCTPDFTIYDETVKNVKVVEDFTTLNLTPIGFLSEGDIYYVLNLTEAYQIFNCSPESDSHYVFFTGATDSTRTVPYNEDHNWYLVGNDELSQENPTWYAKKILYMESIHDTSIGNNPHNGNGNYDLGAGYLEYYRQIFKGSIENDLFREYRERIQAANAKRHYDNRFRTGKLPDVPDITVEYEIGKIGFDIRKCETDYYLDVLTADNAKVWYFLSYDSGIYDGGILSKKPVGDNYFIQTRFGTTDTTTFSEVTAADFPLEYPDQTNQNKPMSDSGSTITVSGTTLNVPESIKSLTDTDDGRLESDELWSYSVINTKNLRITYYLPWEMEDYVTNVVEFYVKQLIPSTVIVDFEWVYTGGGQRPEIPGPYASIRLTPDYQRIRSFETEADIDIRTVNVEDPQISEEYNERR